MRVCMFIWRHKGNDQKQTALYSLIAVKRTQLDLALSQRHLLDS